MDVIALIVLYFLTVATTFSAPSPQPLRNSTTISATMLTEESSTFSAEFSRPIKNLPKSFSKASRLQSHPIGDLPPLSIASDFPSTMALTSPTISLDAGNATAYVSSQKYKSTSPASERNSAKGKMKVMDLHQVPSDKEDVPSPTQQDLEENAVICLAGMHRSQPGPINSAAASEGLLTAYQVSSSDSNMSNTAADTPFQLSSLIEGDPMPIWPSSFPPLPSTAPFTQTTNKALRRMVGHGRIRKARATGRLVEPTPIKVEETSEERKSTQESETAGDWLDELRDAVACAPNAPAPWAEGLQAAHQEEMRPKMEELYPQSHHQSTQNPDSLSDQPVQVVNNYILTQQDIQGFFSQEPRATATESIQLCEPPAHAIQYPPQPTLAEYGKHTRNKFNNLPNEFVSMATNNGTSSAIGSETVACGPVITMASEEFQASQSRLQTAEDFNKNDRSVSAFPSSWGIAPGVHNIRPHTSTFIRSIISSPSGGPITPYSPSGEPSSSASTFDHASNLSYVRTSSLKPGQQSLLVNPGICRETTYAHSGRPGLMSCTKQKEPQHDESEDANDLVKEIRLRKKGSTISTPMPAQESNVGFGPPIGKVPAPACASPGQTHSLTLPSSPILLSYPPSASFQKGSSSSGSSSCTSSWQANGVTHQDMAGTVYSWKHGIEDNMSSVACIGLQAASTALPSNAPGAQGVEIFDLILTEENDLDEPVAMTENGNDPSSVENVGQHQDSPGSLASTMPAFNSSALTQMQIMAMAHALALENATGLQDQQQASDPLAWESSSNVPEPWDGSPSAIVPVPAVDDDEIDMELVATTEGEPEASQEASAPSDSLDHLSLVKENETITNNRPTNTTSLSEPVIMQDRQDPITHSPIVIGGSMDIGTHSIRHTEELSAAHNNVVTSESSGSLNSTLQVDENETSALPPPIAVPLNNTFIHQRPTADEDNHLADTKAQHSSKPPRDDDVYMAKEAVIWRTEASDVSPQWALRPSAPGDQPTVDQEETSSEKPPFDITPPYASSLPVNEIDALVSSFAAMELRTVDDMDVDFPAANNELSVFRNDAMSVDTTDEQDSSRHVLWSIKQCEALNLNMTKLWDGTLITRPYESAAMDVIESVACLLYPYPSLLESRDSTIPDATLEPSPMEVDGMQVTLPGLSAGIAFAQSSNLDESNRQVVYPPGIKILEDNNSTEELDAQRAEPVVDAPEMLQFVELVAAKVPTSPEGEQVTQGMAKDDTPSDLAEVTGHVPIDFSIHSQVLLPPTQSAGGYKYRNPYGWVSPPPEYRQWRVADTVNANTVAISEMAPKAMVDASSSCPHKDSRIQTETIAEDSLRMPGAYSGPASFPFAGDSWTLPVWSQILAKVPVHSLLRRIRF